MGNDQTKRVERIITELESEVLYWKNECKNITEEYRTFRGNLKIILDKIKDDKNYSIIEGGKIAD